MKSLLVIVFSLACTDLLAGPQVKLLDSPFRDNAMRESRFMKGIDVRALTRMFRVTAGLETREADEGKYEFLKGWEEDTIELRGHTCGHWMSGMASLYELTGDEEVKARAAVVVHTLAECQKANGNGYVSAFPESDIDKIIAGTRVWAPWYVIHKILAGLLDQYLVCGNEEALVVAKALGDWTAAKVLPLSEEQAATMRKREFGGIAESLVVLAGITKDEKYLKAAEVFKEKDLYKQINGKHANTLIPKVIADVRYGEWGTYPPSEASRRRRCPSRGGNGERAEKFWNEVVEHYMYAPGCVSTKESFRGPDRQGDFLTGVTGETCCTYNLLKLSRLLWSPARADIADYQERAVWNHILGQMEPIDGHLTYFMPVMTGSYKLQSRPNDSFWCCCGSAMESHTKYQRLVCEEADGALYINNFIPSEIKWKGLVLRLETKFPAEEKARLVVVETEYGERGMGNGERICVRRPFWSLAVENAKSYYEVHERVWKKGDVIDIP
ncbi:MAG: glycoside hydrolase family 127 protein, partial [Kiritimatiellae bacterium]|nr:glycoside hydrolase family 127 protein [Kiritimatiellia bacterium]